MKALKALNRQAMATSVAAIGLGTLGSVASAQVFTDRAAFQEAVSGLTFETFESTPLMDGGLQSLTLPGFVVTVEPIAIKVLGIGDGFGSFNTTPGGSNYLYLDTDIGLQGTVATFDFTSPLSAVCFDYTGVTQPGTTFTALLAGQSYNLSINNGPADTRFWGFIGATPFSGFSLNSGIDSGYGIDQVAFVVVPEPNSLFLLVAGLGGITVFVRSANKRKP